MKDVLLEIANNFEHLKRAQDRQNTINRLMFEVLEDVASHTDHTHGTGYDFGEEICDMCKLENLIRNS